MKIKSCVFILLIIFILLCDIPVYADNYGRLISRDFTIINSLNGRVKTRPFKMIPLFKYYLVIDIILYFTTPAGTFTSIS